MYYIFTEMPSHLLYFQHPEGFCVLLIFQFQRQITHRNFFDLRKHLSFLMVFKSPEFSNDSKSWDSGLQMVFKSPEFSNDSKSWDSGLQKVFKSPEFSNDFKSRDLWSTKGVQKSGI